MSETAKAYECFDCGEIYEDASECPEYPEAHWGKEVALVPCSLDDCRDDSHDYKHKAHVVELAQ